MSSTVRDDALSNVALGSEFRAYLQSFEQPPEVLLVGNYGQGNVGDEAILVGILDACRDVCNPAVLTREPGRLAVGHGVRTVKTGSLASLRRAAQSEVIAIGGGGIFGNGMTLWPKLLPVFGLVSMFFGKQVVFVAIGAYRTAPSGIKRILGVIAARSPFVSVRDEESATVLGNGAIVVRDPALDIRPLPAAAAARALAEVGVQPSRPLLGVSVKAAMAGVVDGRQAALIGVLVDRWISRLGGQVVALCMSETGNFGMGHDAGDVAVTKRILSGIGTADDVVFIGPDVDPRMMMAIVGELDLVVAHRLHAQIFAYAMQIPLIGLSYERKSDQFLDSVGAARVDLWHHVAVDAVWSELCALSSQAPA